VLPRSPSWFKGILLLRGGEITKGMGKVKGGKRRYEDRRGGGHREGSGRD